MIKYIDFDGVIFDSERHLFDGFQCMYKNGLVINQREYLELLDWYTYLHKCKIIKDSLDYIKDDKNSIILGKVCSKQEADAKIKVLKELGYNKECIFIDFDKNKSDIVSPKGNILVDDTIHNLDDWESSEGYSLFFSEDGNQTDPWGNINTRHKSITTLKLLHNIDKNNFEE